MFTDMDYELEEDKLGIPTVPGTVTLKKDAQNLIGISIGGGAQYCPCLYIVQVFDNTPAALDGTLAAGDEITGVNGKPVKGKTKVEVAKMIQTVQGEAVIHYNKLQADPKQGKSLDIVLKKVKHRLVENMSSGTADALGLSRAILCNGNTHTHTHAADALGLCRAILCNDGLVKKLEELEKTAELYKGLMEHSKRLLRAFFELSQTHRAFGDVFSVIGVREPQAAASEAFVKFAEAHRNIEKYGIQLLKTIKPMLHDLNTYLHKAIPDTRLTIRKYLDVKFEYLSYCLKVKEMDDEEYSCIALGEPLYRVSTGNYEYRLILRCRQDARARFAKMRKDVLEKIELLDQKHVQDIVFQLQRFVSGMSRYYDECYAVLKEADVFPIEVDLSRTTINYSSHSQSYEEEEEEGEGECGEGGVSASQAENGAEKLIDDE
ncbi:PRKCA-binding protein isoform X1 [Brachyhypopomus gauderio]|uniref:PRKCA-binding protein isoform X1 n=1 Tax=Brachyhypopomus gauderio TaxID=698409 RepID=UPI0040427BFE